MELHVMLVMDEAVIVNVFDTSMRIDSDSVNDPE